MIESEDCSLDEEIADGEMQRPARRRSSRENADVAREHRASEILVALAAVPGERLSIATVLETLKDCSFASLIVLLGLTNCVPMPPPVPTVSSVLLISVAIQIAAGRSVPWLPAFILRGSIASSSVARAVAKALPHVVRLERWSRPRLWWHGQHLATLLSSLLLAVLAVGILTAAPLFGHIPFGIAVCFVGVGLVERDGMLVVGGVLAGSFGVFVSTSFIYAVIATLRSFI